MRIAGFFRENLGLKLVSLVLAFGGWVYVVGRSPVVRFISAPVEFIAPDGLAVTDYQPREVRVRVQGDAPQLARLSEQNVYARVQLESGMRIGRATKIGVQERDVLGVPPGVVREVVSPPLMVTVERRLVRTVPVRVKMEGRAPDGFTVTRAWSEPASVELSGPEDAIRGVDQIWTEAVNVRSHQRPFTATSELVRVDPLVVLRPETVRVNVIVDEVAKQQDVTVPLAAAPAGTTFEPGKVRVRLEGPPSVLQKLKDGVVATPDLGPLDGKPGMASIQITYPGLPADQSSRLRVVLLDPGRVRVRRTP